MKNDFIKDSMFSLLTHVLIYMKALFLIPVIIKMVGVSTYGTFALLTSFVGIIFGLSSLGVGVKSNRYLPSAKNNEERAKLFFPQFYFKLFVTFLVSIIIVLFQEQIISYFTDENITFSIYIIPIYLLLYTFYVYSYSYLRFTSRIFYMNIIGIAYAYGHVLFILFYANFVGILSINILFISQAIVALLVSIPFIILIQRELNIKVIFFKMSELKEEIRIGFPLRLNFIVDFILNATDRFVLAYFMGVYAVGLYVPAYAIGSIILLIPKSLSTVVPQLMSKSVDNDNFLQAKSLFLNSIKIYMVLSVPFVFGMYMIGYDILILFANEEVAKKGRNIATLIAFASIFYGLNIMMTQANMVELKTKAIFKANLIAAGVNLVLNIILLYFIKNMYIPAITTVISFMIATIYFYKSLDSKWLDNKIFILFGKILFASFLMFGFCDYINPYMESISIYSKLFLEIIFSIAVYILLIFIFKIYTVQQIKELKRVFMKSE